MSSWVRLWHDMPTDPKWRVIAKASGQSIGNVIAVFNFLLVEASKNATERGRTQSFNCEDVAAALDISETDVQKILDAMQGRVLENDVLKGWEKRQPLREDNSASRAKLWRERNRTQPNAQERPDADADAEQNREDKAVDDSAREEILKLTGWGDSPNWTGNFSRLMAWQEAGYDLRLDIIPTIKAVMAKKTTGPPRSLNYFDQAIADAHATRIKPVPKGNPDGKAHFPSNSQGGGKSQAAKAAIFAGLGLNAEG